MPHAALAYLWLALGCIGRLCLPGTSQDWHAACRALLGLSTLARVELPSDLGSTSTRVDVDEVLAALDRLPSELADTLAANWVALERYRELSRRLEAICWPVLWHQQQRVA